MFDGFELTMIETSEAAIRTPGINPGIKGYEIHPIWFVTVSKLSR
jgi:hypothetical protein